MYYVWAGSANARPTHKSPRQGVGAHLQRQWVCDLLAAVHRNFIRSRTSREHHGLGWTQRSIALRLRRSRVAGLSDTRAVLSAAVTRLVTLNCMNTESNKLRTRWKPRMPIIAASWSAFGWKKRELWLSQPSRFYKYIEREWQPCSFCFNQWLIMRQHCLASLAFISLSIWLFGV